MCSQQSYWFIIMVCLTVGLAFSAFFDSFCRKPGWQTNSRVDFWSDSCSKTISIDFISDAIVLVGGVWFFGC
jgi:hypothetical protein